jgi:hypothetical protein
MTYGFSFLGGSIAWRFPLAFQLVFSFILLGTVPWLPESSRWLLAHGYDEEGVRVLVALEGNGVTAKDDLIVDQCEEILEAVRIEKETAPKWSDIIRGKTGETGMIQRLLLGAGEPKIKRRGDVQLIKFTTQGPSGCSSLLELMLPATSTFSLQLRRYQNAPSLKMR